MLTELFGFVRILFARVWCNGNTAAFQASVTSSNLVTRSKIHPLEALTRGGFFIELDASIPQCFLEFSLGGCVWAALSAHQRQDLLELLF